jgi:hypothetical protein
MSTALLPAAAKFEGRRVKTISLMLKYPTLLAEDHIAGAALRNARPLSLFG